ncbi:MAG: S49 family peptidase [Planctomycetota bacterium]
MRRTERASGFGAGFRRVTHAAAAAALCAVAGQAGAAKLAVAELTGTPLEQPGPFAWLMGEMEPTLLEVCREIESLPDRDVDGVVLRLKDAILSPAQIDEIGEAMRSARDAGVDIHVFADQLTTQELLIAAHADTLLIQKGGGVMVSGLLVEEMFLADTLAWAGLEAQMVQVGDYKGANEQMTRTSPSPAWDQNISGLLDAMYGLRLDAMVSATGMQADEVEDAVREAWLTDADRAVEAGLAHASVDLAALSDHFADHYGESIEWSSSIEFGGGMGGMDTSNPFAMLQLLSSEPDHSPDGPTIAVLHIEGAIIDGESMVSGFGGGQQTGSRTIRRAIEDILAEDLIEGVVVRIESPGGSAIASEVMWQGLQRLADEKPVWVSVGSMAASGGYYTLVGGERVFANPSSIVGSIGVVGGKVAVGGLLDKIKVGVTTRARGPLAGMFSSDTWSDAELELIRDRMQRTYDLFTKRVKHGRPGIDLSETAEGRLFVGSDAVGLDMVDSIGGLAATIDALADAEGVRPGFDVLHYPGPQSFEDFLESALGGFPFAANPNTEGSFRGLIAEALRTALGEARFRSVAHELDAWSQLRTEPVLLTVPRALFIR